MKLIAIDLDGTLLSRNHHIQEKDIFWIRQMQSEGNIVAIATGRAYFDTLHIVKSHRLNCPIIACNGAQIYINDEKLQEQFITEETVTNMVAWLQTNNIYFQLYLADKIVVWDRGIKQLEKQLKKVVDEAVQFDQHKFWESIKPQINQFGLEEFSDITDIPLKHLATKVMIVSPDKKIIQEVLAQLSQFAGCDLSSSGEFNLEIMSSGVDKGLALQLLAKRCQIDINDTVAIGDNFNDLPMFQVAGASILMGNGEIELQNTVTFMTLTNEECGVGHALEFFLPLLDQTLKGNEQQHEKSPRT